MTPRTASIVLLAAVSVIGGCYEYRVKHDGWETFRSQIGGDPPGGPVSKKRNDGTAPAGTNSGWAILVETFEGGTRFRRASDLIRRLTNRYAVSELWLQDNEGKTKVYRGRYESLTDLEAQRALMQTRSIEEDGERPYEKVELVSLGGDGTRAATSHDLRTYSGQGFYTLQIGFYDEEYGPDFRDAAEAFAAEMRREGHRAFYYHGPSRSMVTVDLFTDADFDQDGPVRVYGSRMLGLQETFKFNLGNGRTIIETISDGKKTQKREQPSFVVKVP